LRNAVVKPFRRRSVAPFESAYLAGLPLFGRNNRRIISSFQG
jgi:hypothetical protein